VYRGYLVDVFGTLVHDDESRILAICKQISELSGASVEAVEGEWETRIWAAAEDAWGGRFRSLADLNLTSLQGTAAHFGVPLDVPALIRRSEPALAPLFGDSLVFLDAVQERGAPVCLVSDADRGDLERLLLRHRVVVEGVVTSEDARAYKPRAEPFLMALDKLGLSPADVIHVGDSPVADLAGAAALGIDTAFVDRDGRGLPDGVGATYVVRSLTELA
jgi:FMN phosphatase YigB (HAD superfamily)